LRDGAKRTDSEVKVGKARTLPVSRTYEKFSFREVEDWRFSKSKLQQRTPVKLFWKRRKKECSQER